MAPQQLPPARWRLGHQTCIAVNASALAYLAFVFFWCFWPNTIMQTLNRVDWAVVIFVGVFIVALVMYVVQGRKSYKPPVDAVIGRGTEVVGLR
jgi:uncharacterized membrane protein (DUF485 family)